MDRADYPKAPRGEASDDLHGHQVPDPYRWLELPESTEAVEWSQAQDELFRGALKTWPGQERLRTRVGELIAAGYVGVPVWRGPRQFLLRRVADQEHAILLTIDEGGTERVLIDPMQIDPTGATTLDAWQPSKEGDLLAYQLSEGGREESVVRVMDVGSGEVVDGPIDRTRYSPIAWLPGGKQFFYVRQLPSDRVPDGEEQFHRRVWLHTVGTATDDDVLVFGEGLDFTNYYGVSVSLDGRWLEVSASAGTAPRNDVWMADLSSSSATDPDLVPVQVDVDAQLAINVGRDGRVYIYTDRDAPRGRLMTTEPGQWAYEQWSDLIPEAPDAVFEGYAVLDGPEMAEPVLLVARTRHAVGSISIHDLATGRHQGDVPLPGLGTLAGMSERPEGGHEAWFGYTDFTTPMSIFRYDATNSSTTTWAKPPGSVDVPRVVSEQVTYTSVDGTPVRMFILSAEGAEGPQPTILYGYGGFGVPLSPAFSATVLTWVEAGGRYAVANLRGGSEEGEQWHRDGMRDKKQNVFDDFLCASTWLIDNGRTGADQLALSGGSNGGLLVGAALTQRPDLFSAVVCSAPLLDMVRYEQFGLGQTWNDEFGTADDPQELEWLLAYSPYHRVEDGVDYPAVLFTVFDGDTRVDPLHARKMAAALQHATAGTRPILIRREADVGHGARAVSRAIELSVDTLCFTAFYTGLSLEP
jgi:prolyl oligopeptidase